LVEVLPYSEERKRQADTQDKTHITQPIEQPQHNVVTLINTCK